MLEFFVLFELSLVVKNILLFLSKFLSTSISSRPPCLFSTIFGNEPGDIILHEHGPRGGDEINVIRERDSIREEPLLTRNYGWPIVSNGINYNGTSFTNLTSMEGTESPLYFWTPSIAPSGMAMLTSDLSLIHI